MLLVAGSGIFGLHIYARIHRGLYGRRTSLDELRGDLAESLESNHGLATLMPNLMSKLVTLSTEIQGDNITRSLGLRASLTWTLRQYVVWMMLTTRTRLSLQSHRLSLGCWYVGCRPWLLMHI